VTASETVSASLEDYLEVIYGLIQKHRVARSRDIARRMEVTGASVTGALRALAEKELINYAPYELITLTEEGERLAEKVVGRHQALKEFFVTVLGVDQKEAGENACRIEHAVSEALMERLVRFVEFLHVCPRAGVRWLVGFRYFCEHPECGRSEAECEGCLSRLHDRFEPETESKPEGTAAGAGTGSKDGDTTHPARGR
jgi:DtxR family Mn-dependent transcriptional regulator